MQIANPIYDVVFKYLMEDNNIAKLLISSIIDQKIITLDFQPQESTLELQEQSLTVYRLDFSARIKTPEGERDVLIEIQKSKLPADIIRFRKYLDRTQIIVMILLKYLPDHHHTQRNYYPPVMSC